MALYSIIYNKKIKKIYIYIYLIGFFAELIGGEGSMEDNASVEDASGFEEYLEEDEGTTIPTKRADRPKEMSRC